LRFLCGTCSREQISGSIFIMQWKDALCLQAFWRAAGLSGEAVVNGGKPSSRDCDSGPLCLVFDCTSSFGNAALVAFIGGDLHLQYQSLMVAIIIVFVVR